MDDDVREALEDETSLEDLSGHPGWAIYRKRLIGRLGELFLEFLTEPHARLPELQGAGRALWDQLREVDGSETRRVALQSEIQLRHEAALAADRERADMEATSSMARFRQGPRRPGVPLG